MSVPTTTGPTEPTLTIRQRSTLWRRWQEFRLIGQDPILAVGLLIVGIFVFVFVAFPILRVVWQGFFEMESGEFNLQYFGQYIDPYYRGHHWEVLRNTMVMGLATAAGGTLLGFVFAYTMVRCSVPGEKGFHVVTLLPTISPPFAIAIATILLFGRNGLITRQILGIRPVLGSNDIYGLDGLVFVQIITFFPVAYLIIRAMLERIDPSMEEAALSLRASKFHIFRTITLPLLVPGLAGSFLLLFVESLADLGNPLILGGNVSVLSTEIFLAVNGEYNQQKAAALSLVLLVPTLTVFIVQRYYVSKRSYISVTGKPTTGRAYVKEPLIRWSFIIVTALVLALVLVLYLSLLVGSFSRLWGIDYTLDLSNYSVALGRGLNAILSTTFLSAVATPIAGLVGMVTAFMVVRRTFAGKQALDFVSNLGGAVPGTILGIGYIIAFINAPMIVVVMIYVLLALYMLSRAAPSRWGRIAILLVATVVGYAINWTPYYLGLTEGGWRLLIAGGFLLVAAIAWFAAEPDRRLRAAIVPVLLALGLIVHNLSERFTTSLSIWGRTLPGLALPKVVTRVSASIEVIAQPTMAIIGFTGLVLALYAIMQVPGRWRPALAGMLLALCASLVFFGSPLALVGTPYIIIAAYAVRSLPASVRAGVASLQQIDPSIEEASTNLGANAQYTFRNVTLPLILPAFIAGLIFAFARHMTSLSAVIFLTTAEWPILTVWILSEVEQGGMSVAAAYSVILIFIVLAAIGLMYAWLGRTYRSRDAIDLTMGGG